MNTNCKYEFFLIGTGATGSQLLPMLTQLLNNTESKAITLIDGDDVEYKNLKNQKFLEKDIGYHKVQVLAERYQRVYPDLAIRYIPEFIKSKDMLLKLLICSYWYDGNIPVLIGCVDNIETRKVICEALEEFEENNKYIYIDGGNGTADRNGQIVISSNIPKYMYKLPWDIYHDIKDSTETVDKALSCGAQTDKNPQNIATMQLQTYSWL